MESARTDFDGQREQRRTAGPRFDFIVDIIATRECAVGQRPLQLLKTQRALATAARPPGTLAGKPPSSVQLVILT